MTATDVPFWRSPIPQRICSCGCSHEAHRIDLKTEPCDSCPCTAFTLRWLDWTEKRVVREDA